MSESKLNVICILGGPGAGKSTLCAALANKIPSSIVLKSGSMIRASINSHGHGDSKHITAVMDKGGLVDDNVVCKIVNEEIRKIISKGADHNVILDGYPRTVEQLKHFDIEKINLCGLIILEAPELILEKRCKIRNLRTDRIDDLEQPVIERVNDFLKHIDAILDELAHRSLKYLKLSSCGSVEETSQKAITFALQLNLD